MKQIRVAEVEYNDDDGYDQHNLIRINEDDTEETITEHLYDQGFISCYVDDIIEEYSVEDSDNSDFYDVIECLDD